MNIIYEAFDGKRFDNEFDCESYEFCLQHLAVKTVTLYDEDGEEYKVTDYESIFADAIYWDCYKINFPNQRAYEDFMALAGWCGWSEFNDCISSPGMWEREEDRLGNPRWIKIG